MSFVAYWLVGLPLSYILVFKLGWNIFGLRLGLMFGPQTYMVLLMVHIHRANWQDCCDQSKA